MRRKRDPQRTFQELKPNWNKAQELAKIDEILQAHPQLCDGVAQDLGVGQRQKVGAKGMTAEQVLRVAIIKQLKQLTYRELEDRIEDSERVRAFCRFGDHAIPRYNTLAENVKRIGSQTWSQINTVLVSYAKAKGIEKGRKVRIDSTAVETPIHYPTDARLIEDCVRVTTRLMRGAAEWFGKRIGPFHDRRRRVKKRVFRIANTKSPLQRQQDYRDLLTIGQAVHQQATLVCSQLSRLEALSFEEELIAKAIKQDLEEVLTHFPGVLDQCRRRVLEGESVPAAQKVVSIFEPHSDVIVKGSRQTLFGHKICLSGGSSNMILGCLIERGNPSDSELYLPALKQASTTLGQVPIQVCTDDGFASEGNAAAAQALGVEDVVFGGKLKNELTRWVRSAWVQKQLRRFRAGIESVISANKRAFGLARCTWSSWNGFQSYVWLSIVAWNLQVLARHLLC